MSTPARILLIDDDRKLCRLVRDYLSPLGYAVAAVHDGVEGAKLALAEKWDAVILDVMLPGLDGLEVLRRLRQESGIPVLMLTARGDEADRIVGLELGADDYLPKTFSPRELLARLRAVLRRVQTGALPVAGTASELRVRDLKINTEARSATLAGEPLVLTPVEFELLVTLARAKGRVKTREQLVDEIRDREYEVFDRSVDVHISSLRRKLKDDAREPRYLRTLRAAGYMMIDPEGRA
ncbi:MAG: response regulator transcription factor [Verrucomicrobiaceae bacterium]|nr:MAG: response regulator transcription factor [Verrucomicrobiaceae bacterium]